MKLLSAKMFFSFQPLSVSQLVFLLIFSVFSPCLAQNKSRVVTTTAMIGDVVKNLAADCVDVEVMMGPGIDPHLYKASASDVKILQNASIIFYSGLNLEGQLAKVLDNLKSRRPVIAVTEAIPEDQLLKTGHGYGIDPHVWMSAALWAQTVDLVSQELAKLEPECVSSIQERASHYKLQLSSLHDWVKSSIASIPEEQRLLVTAHDAFAYYGEAYALEVAGIQGISTESEAAIADIRETVDLVIKHNVPAIFVETTISPRTIEAVKQAALDKGHSLEIGGRLYSDAMGEEGTVGGSYIGMIYVNTKTITEALGGTPARLPEALEAWGKTWNLP